MASPNDLTELTTREIGWLFKGLLALQMEEPDLPGDFAVLMSHVQQRWYTLRKLDKDNTVPFPTDAPVVPFIGREALPHVPEDAASVMHFFDKPCDKGLSHDGACA